MLADEEELREKQEQIRVLQNEEKAAKSLKEVLRRAKEERAALMAPSPSFPSQQGKGACVASGSTSGPFEDSEEGMPWDTQGSDVGTGLPPPAKRLRLDRESSLEVQVERSDK